MIHEHAEQDFVCPLVTVIIHDYAVENLRSCLDSILGQTILDNIEILFFDRGSTDGFMEIGTEYALNNPGRVTLHRAKAGDNRFRNICHGRYYLTLSNSESFQPDLVLDCVRTMEVDPDAAFDMVKKVHPYEFLPPDDDGMPVVSILIFNYNYGRYLAQCLESVVTQTYKNIEVILSDNASTDDSWSIALEYARRYPERVTIIRNRENGGGEANQWNCHRVARGRYFCILGSDDAVMPEFVERCVNALQASPGSGYAMVHRAIIDANGERTDEPPFYDQSCVIPGSEQAAVYVLAAVNPSISQILYDRLKVLSQALINPGTNAWMANRLVDFDLSCSFSMVYIKDPLILHRIHAASDTSKVDGNLVQLFAQYLLTYQFAERVERTRGLEKAAGRLSQALEKLSRLCLRYCLRGLVRADEVTALRYFHLAIAIDPAVRHDPIFQELGNYWTTEGEAREKILEVLRDNPDLAMHNLITRQVSYAPPPGSTPIPVGGRASDKGGWCGDRPEAGAEPPVVAGSGAGDSSDQSP